MKQVILYLRFIGLISCIAFMAVGCHKTTVGYLQTENAIYVPDSMVVKSVLDETEDARRIKFTIPWQSTSIEGVLGTVPVKYSIRSIDSDNGYLDAMSQIQAVRKGVIEIPYNHTLPTGRYIINLEVWNEGHIHRLDSVYTVIVN